MTERHEAIAQYLNTPPSRYRFGLYPIDELKELTQACGPISTLTASSAPHVASMYVELHQSAVDQGQALLKPHLAHGALTKAKEAARIGVDDADPTRAITAALRTDSVGIMAYHFMGRKDGPNVTTSAAWRQTIRTAVERGYRNYTPDNPNIPFMQLLMCLGALHYMPTGETDPVYPLAPTRFSETTEFDERYDLVRIKPDARFGLPVRIGTERTMGQLCIVPAWLANDAYPDPKKGLGTAKALMAHFEDEAQRKNRAAKAKSGPITKPKPPHQATVFLGKVSALLDIMMTKQWEDTEAYAQSLIEGHSIGERPESWFEQLTPIDEPMASEQGRQFMAETLSERMVQYLENDGGKLLQVRDLAWLYAEQAMGTVRWIKSFNPERVEGDFDTALSFMQTAVRPQKKKHKEEHAQLTQAARYSLQFDEAALAAYKVLFLEPHNAEAGVAQYRRSLALIAGDALFLYDTLQDGSAEKQQLEPILHELSIVLLFPPDLGIALRATLRQRGAGGPREWGISALTLTDEDYNLALRHKLRPQKEANIASARDNNVATVDYEYISSLQGKVDFAPLRHMLGNIEDGERLEAATEKLLTMLEQVRPA